jgi:hypothetical protein
MNAPRRILKYIAPILNGIVVFQSEAERSRRELFERMGMAVFFVGLLAGGLSQHNLSTRRQLGTP